MKKDGEKFDIYAVVTEKVMEAIEKAIQTGERLPWNRPWSTGGGRAMKASSKRPYSFLNEILLAVHAADHGCRSIWWGTMKKINELGGTVLPGSKSCMVTFWSVFEKKVDATDVDGNPFVKMEKRFVLRYYRVFNFDQTEGIDRSKWPEPGDKRLEFKPIEAAEKVLAGLAEQPTIVPSTRAYYQPGADRIGMPVQTSFTSPEAYYGTLFHELTHWTGGASRLNREEVVKTEMFGSEAYSREELVAEMGSSFLSAHCGIDESNIKQSVAYLTGWLKALKNDKKMLVSAASRAEKAVRFILGDEEQGEESEDAQAA